MQRIAQGAGERGPKENGFVGAMQDLQGQGMPHIIPMNRRRHCALLQRARQALGGEELETLRERAEFFGLDKTKNFEDFQKKYLKVADDIPLYKANITGGLKKYTEKEVKALTKEMGHIANKYTDIAGT